MRASMASPWVAISCHQRRADVAAAQHADAHHGTVARLARHGAIVGAGAGARLVPGTRSAAAQPTSLAQQVVERLAAHDHPGLPVGDEHHRRAGHLVVVGAHRVAVGAGDRRGQHVADGEVGGHLGLAHEHVARLAVLAHDA